MKKPILILLAVMLLLLCACGAAQKLPSEPEASGSDTGAVTEPADDSGDDPALAKPVPIEDLPQPPEVTEEPKIITVSGHEVTIHDIFPENRFVRENFYRNEEGRIECASQGAALGVDVSEWQGKIDWKAAAADGVEFAFVRIGWRGYSKGIVKADTNWQANLKGARDAGLQVGVYFYSQALNAQEGEEEAKFVLKLLGKNHLDLPVYFDWEHVDEETARTLNITPSEYTDAAVAFCRTIQAGGYEASIYANRYVAYLLFEPERLTDYSIWYACYYSWPDYDYDFDIWQYTNEGTVAGIKGQVDMNLMLLPNRVPREPVRPDEPNLE